MKTTFNLMVKWTLLIWLYALGLLSAIMVLGGAVGISMIETVIGDHPTARLQTYSNEIFALVLAGSGVMLFVRVVCWCLKEKINNKQWVRDHRLFVACTVAWPTMIVSIPILEETIFRLPLLMWFPDNQRPTWLPITLGASLFAAMHLGNRLFHQTIVEEIEYLNGKVDEDDATKLDEHAMRRLVNIRLAAQVIVTFVFGLAIGWLGIEYQSLWFCVKCHIALNFFVLVLSPFVVLAVFLLVVLVCLAASKCMDCLRRLF